MYNLEYKNRPKNIVLFENPAYDTWQNQLNTQQSRINAAQTALQKNQTALQEAINLQKGQIAAGNDAVNWGLIAKNAEAQGLNNAQQAYNGLMAQWANNFANTPAAISNFGGGGK
jgi:Tfp pilus assembly protein PilE